MEIVTADGPAAAEVDEVPGPRFLLVLTHGAGGGVDGADLLAARQAGLARGGCVARVVQPYRVRGARAPGSAVRQDAAWLEIVAALRQRYGPVPLIQGGRSNGGRVACRTARAAGARGVLAMAFPLHPPGRPEVSRAAELLEAGTDVLVLNGENDPFGIPEPTGTIRVAILPRATHTLARQGGEILRAVGPWLGWLLDGGEPVAGPGPG